MKIKLTQNSDFRDTMNEFGLMLSLVLILTAMTLILINIVTSFGQFAALISLGVSILVCICIANFDIEL